MKRQLVFIPSRCDALVSVERQHVAQLSLSAAQAGFQPRCMVCIKIIEIEQCVIY